MMRSTSIIKITSRSRTTPGSTQNKNQQQAIVSPQEISAIDWSDIASTFQFPSIFTNPGTIGSTLSRRKTIGNIIWHNDLRLDQCIKATQELYNQKNCMQVNNLAI